MDIPGHNARQRRAQPLSSLDVAWSYSRAEARVGSVLSNEPSFIDHYRPPELPEADSHDAIPAGQSSHMSLADATDDGSDFSEAAAEPRESEEFWPPHETEHRLPSNAVSFPGSSWQDHYRPSSFSASGDERASLLHSDSQPSATAPSASLSTSPPEDVPFARRARSFQRPTANPKEDTSSIANIPGGSSSDAATMFNMVNSLVGISLLALPKAVTHAGWFFGIGCCIFASLITCYTAKLMSRAIHKNPALISFTDIVAHGLGARSRAWVNLTILIELGCAAIALMVLSTDNLSALFPAFSPKFFKLCSFIFTVPAVFLPFRVLSYASLLGLFTIILLLVVVYIDGFLKPDAPGSLRQPAHTSLWPIWKDIPISFGVVMAGFAAHAIVPALYRDMKRPKHFERVVDYAWLIVSAINIAIAVAGYLMFGNAVSAEISQDLLNSPASPQALNRMLVWCMAISPMCKFALVFAPLHATLEAVLGLAHQLTPREWAEESAFSATYSTFAHDVPVADVEDSPISSKTVLPSTDRRRRSSVRPTSLQRAPRLPEKWGLTLLRWLVKCLMLVVLVIVTIVWPDFEKVIGVLGSSGAILVSVMLPIGAATSINWREYSRVVKVLHLTLLAFALVMSVTGTIASARSGN